MYIMDENEEEPHKKKRKSVNKTKVISTKKGEDEIQQPKNDKILLEKEKLYL